MNTPIIVARRAASSSSFSSSTICLSCRRTLLRQFSSARRLAAPEFQSYRLNTTSNNNQHPPSPPRSAGGPDTSITHPIEPPLPRVHETRPPREGAVLGSIKKAATEAEAQRSRSEFAPASAETSSQQQQAEQQQPPSTTRASSETSSSSPSPPVRTTTATTKARPRSKLRAPRKAAMQLTPAAVSHLQALLDQPDPKLIKVGVRNRGCSGLAYHLEFVDRPGAFDETVEQDGVRVLIDSKALFSIIGSEMDWVEDKLNQRFVFRNPNISEFCLPLFEVFIPLRAVSLPGAQFSVLSRDFWH